MNRHRLGFVLILSAAVLLGACSFGRGGETEPETTKEPPAAQTGESETEIAVITLPSSEKEETQETTAKDTAPAETTAETVPEETTVSVEEDRPVSLSPDWTYAEFSKINSGSAMLYHAQAVRKNKTVCVNAGHGTEGGSSVKTQCHPDGTPKVTGGTTEEGAVYAIAVSSGTDFDDGTPEANVSLELALILKEKLLADGYDVLMIRETEDVQLDNIARTVIANNTADIHIALHWDDTSSDKGAFYMSVPDVASYRAMEPVRSCWQEHDRLGDSLIEGLRSVGEKIFESGSMEMDLTQTSYSTIPSVDIEMGDRASDHSQEALEQRADGLLAGIDIFFGFSKV